jgi:hypothetical protein
MFRVPLVASHETKLHAPVICFIISPFVEPLKSSRKASAQTSVPTNALLRQQNHDQVLSHSQNILNYYFFHSLVQFTFIHIFIERINDILGIHPVRFSAEGFLA